MAYGTLVKADPVILGSGELYLGTVKADMTTEEKIDAALENIGAIESGATLKYTPTFKEIETANRGVIAKFITKEEVVFNCGVMTWLLDNLARLAPATVTKEDDKKVLKIGGKGSIPVNYLRFEHIKPDGKKLTVNIAKAVNNGGFEFTFDKENSTVINYEFSALAQEDGTLVEIIEEI